MMLSRQQPFIEQCQDVLIFNYILPFFPINAVITNVY